MRRAAILVTSLVTLAFAGCNLYFDDDGHHGKNHPGDVDAGPAGGGTPDASCGGGGHGDADGGFFPDGGTWPDAGYQPPDASPDW